MGQDEEKKEQDDIPGRGESVIVGDFAEFICRPYPNAKEFSLVKINGREYIVRSKRVIRIPDDRETDASG